MRWISALAAALGVAACGGATKNLDLGPPPEQAEPEQRHDPVPQAPRTAPEDTAVSAKPSETSSGPLLLQGTPEIPGALVARLEQYNSVRRASVSDISEDGRKLLVATRFGETTQIHLVDGPGRARRQLSFGGEPASGAMFIPGRTDAIVYSTDTGGNEQHQIMRMDLGTGRAAALTTAGSRNGAYVFSRDGRQLAYMSNRRNGKDFDVWVSDGRDPKSARLAVEGKGYFFPVGFSRDGKKLLVREYVSINESQLYVHDFAKGATARLTPDGKVAYRSAIFGRDSNTVYVSSDRNGEFAELYEVDLRRGNWRPLTRHIPWNVTGASISGDGKRVAVAVNEGGITKLYLLSTATRKLSAVGAVGARMVGSMVWARRAGTLALSLASATLPGDAFVYDPRSRKLVRWTHSELGGLNPTTLVEPKLIHYQTFDGRKIPAWLYRPAGKGPFPVVVSIHGGPEGQARPYFSALTQYLVSESGFAVIMPNVRGSDGYGKSYLKLDNGYGREESVKDIGALLDWIDEQPDLDGRRVAVRGGSYGGYMVLASLVHYSPRLAAGIDVVGISNFVTFLKNTADYRRDLRRAEYGDERDPKMAAHLQKISPLSQVDKIRSPLFVAQGANDPRVPASEAEQVVAAVRKTGKDVWYMLAKNEGHGFRKKSNRDIYTQLSVLFLEKHLK